jgi:hypothetical protein
MNIIKITALAGIVTALGLGASACGSAITSPTPAVSTRAPAARGAQKAAPAPRTTRVVVFKVWGTGSPSISYGSDHQHIRRGNGALPFRASMPYKKSAVYYYIDARPTQQDRHITAVVSLKVTHYFSNGTHRSSTKVWDVGHARGRHSLADPAIWAMPGSRLAGQNGSWRP